MNDNTRFPNLWQSVVLVIIFAMIILWTNVVFGILSGLLKLNLAQSWITISLASISSFAVVVAVAILWGGYSITSIFSLAPFELRLLPFALLGFLGLHFLASEVDNITQYFLPAPQSIKTVMEKIFSEESQIGTFFSIVIIAPIVEEIFLRGIILRGLLMNHSKTVALLVSSLLFGLLHLNPWMLLPTTLIGIALGWVYIRTSSVPLCILCHAFNNLTAFVLAYSKVEISGYLFSDPTQSAQFQPISLDIAALVLFIVGFTTFSRFTKEDKELVSYNLLQNEMKMPSPPVIENSDNKPPIISDHNQNCASCEPPKPD
ncbi:MAG: CPBP family intramembrane glutamic endopeptidase [Verrucomicrobiia bacterium]|jgi:membrane protease YdiL (CAAX protease family)